VSDFHFDWAISMKVDSDRRVSFNGLCRTTFA